MRYEEYFELSEKTGWRVTDLDWDALDADDKAGLISDFDREVLLGSAVIEHGVPHYADVWGMVDKLHQDWELWQFTTLWTGEEHRHSYALKKACDRLGIGNAIAGDLTVVREMAFAQRQKDTCPTNCYSTIPGMLAYAVIQELATARFYHYAAKRTESPFLKKLLNLIGTDEMRHHVYYRNSLKACYELSPDKAWYVDRVFESTQSFKMPHLIYHLREEFFERADWTSAGEILPQLAKCFAFDMTLLARLAAVYPVAAALPAEALVVS